MNEREWLECVEPEAMLEFEKQRPSGSVRKQRLFACACCRQVADLMADARCREAVQVAERFADGLADADDIVAAFEITSEIADEQRAAHGARAALIAGLANVACEESSEVAYWAYQFLLDLTPEDIRPVRQTWGKHAVHCIFGNPFRPTTDPARVVRSGAVRDIAAAIYDDGAIDRLPILADAVEDAGCIDLELLGHLRGHRPHYRGCWAVDLLSGKE
jgi:hypothetical protein